MRNAFKSPPFLIGFMFIAILLFSSILNGFIYGEEIIQENTRYNSEGEAISSAPFPPSLAHPLGTDTDGYDLAHIIIHGAKYTLGAAICVSIGRVFISLFLSLIVTLYFKRLKHIIKEFSQSFSFIPSTLFTYFMLVSVVTMSIDGFQFTFSEQVVFQVFIMTIIAIPSLTLFLSEEMERFYTKPFVDGAKILGGSRLHVFKNHIFPYIKPVLFVSFGQNVVNALLILAHLGVLNLFFGGTYISFSPFTPVEKNSISYEWSGLIGSYLPLVATDPWIPLVPVLFFALSSIAIQLCIVGYQSSIDSNQNLKISKTSRKNELKEKEKHIQVKESDFKSVKQNV
ncbi:ABC transporter permease [Guptibacillus algicola]|uniref:ABC transporter permease n=1 Tax=Guptibacillus algicola TaxID=225844 RepID=UPI001CD71F3A|nr:ABC transporter permease subunit [Alkalihalobacillus algicola]MCA0986526.1 ABC transporter permease subunit [Alkalihalobacillus algicola]